MKLTVITINYNNLLGLKKTLESVFEQSFQDFEYIMIDGGSKDGSKELIESYAHKFDYWVSERDGGIFNAMNKGIEKATGDYIIHMNSGDTFFAKDTLEKVMPELKSEEDLICGDSNFINNLEAGSDYIWQAPKKVSFRFFSTDTLNHQSIFIKRSLFKKVGLYREDYKAASDWIFLIQSCAFHKAKYKKLNLIVSNYDRSGFSSVNWQIGAREQQDIFKKEFSFFYDSETMEDLKWYVPFWKNFKRNFKRLIKVSLPYGLVRYREVKNATERRKELGIK